MQEFTIKYRRIGGEWIWVNSNSNTSNGSIIFQSSTLPEELSDLFSKFTSRASIQSVKSDVDSTKLWSIEYEVSAANKKSSFQESFLGVPVYVSRWWALVRQWAAWLIPAHGYGVFQVDKDAIICSFQRFDGLHLVLLGVSGVDNVQVVFRDDGLAGVTVCARSDDSEAIPARVLASIGYSHETALAACMYAARHLVQRGSLAITGQVYSEPTLKDDLRTNWYSSWSDGLGYCTWNGLGQKLNEQNIFEALRILRENGVQIQTLIIDDNWQTLDQSASDHHYHTWSDFEANQEGFPHGLASTIAEIRQQNPALKHIAVWHAILGYWGGLTRDGPIAQNYKTRQVKRMDTPKKGFEATTMTVIDADHVQALYTDFYAFLSKCQVDGVKTDVQMMLDLFEDADDRRELIRAYQDAWTLTGLQNFQDKMISCMSHFPANFFHSLLPSRRPTITLRNSDDFQPDIPDSHGWHVFVNAHNGLFTQHLNVIPDWDMFQTTNEYAAFHAAARCISGGTIYITDEPGKHDFDLIGQMTAETISGSRVILRPSCIARAVTSSVYISNTEPRLLKVGSYHGRSSTGVGLLGVFNCSNGPLLDLVHLQDFRGTLTEQEYIVRSFASGKPSNVMKPSDKISIISVDLPVRGWDILTAYPVFTWSRDDKSTKIAPLGLIDKMSGAAAVLDYTVNPNSGQRLLLSIVLKAMGILGKSSPSYFRFPLLTPLQVSTSPISATNLYKMTFLS